MKKSLYRLVVPVAIVFGIQCSEHSPTIGGGDDTSKQGVVQLDIRLSKAVAQRIDRVIAIAKHPILGTVTEELTITGTRATGSLEVPAGTGWVVIVEAYVGDVVCRRGRSDPVDVSPGEVVPVVITPVRLDSDNDGFFNEEDLFPYGDAKIQVVLKRFTVFVEDGAWDPASEIYFRIYVDGTMLTAPEEGYIWKCDVEEYVRPDWSGEVDVDDNVRYHDITIEMWDSDSLGGDDLYDIDSDATEGDALYLTYDLKMGTWSGDDTDGITSGSGGYLEYEIRTVVR